MSRSEPTTSGGKGFTLIDEASRDDTRKTGLIIGATVALAVLAIVWAFVWMDRPSPPLPGEMLSPVWLRAPAQGFERVPR